MIISTVNYRETFITKPDITRILGIPTYYALHKMKIEIKTNALYIHSNLGDATHINLGIFMTDTKYATLSNVLYVRTVHPGTLLIPKNTMRVESYEIKRVYDENLQVFHKVSGVKQELIKKVFTAVKKKYTKAMKKQATCQFTGNIRQIFSYLLTTYRKFSLSQLNDFEKEATKIHYDLVTPVDNIFNKVEDLLKYRDTEKYPYSHPQ